MLCLVSHPSFLLLLLSFQLHFRSVHCEAIRWGGGGGYKLLYLLFLTLTHLTDLIMMNKGFRVCVVFQPALARVVRAVTDGLSVCAPACSVWVDEVRVCGVCVCACVFIKDLLGNSLRVWVGDSHVLLRGTMIYISSYPKCVLMVQIWRLFSLLYIPLITFMKFNSDQKLLLLTCAESVRQAISWMFRNTPGTV